MSTEPGRRQWRRVSRDTVILTFALGLAAIEVMLFGARPAVLTFVTGLLLSPLVLRADEARRNGRK